MNNREEALPELRWREQPVVQATKNAPHTVRVFLQQLWRVPREPTPQDLSASRVEWRDVPVAAEDGEDGPAE